MSPRVGLAGCGVQAYREPMRRALVLVPAAVLATLLTIAPAAAVPGLDLWVDGGRHEVGRGVVDPTGVGQLLTAEIAPGRTRDVGFVVRNTGNTPATVTVRGDAGGGRVSVVYRDPEWNDVTAAVVAGTFEVVVPGRREWRLTAELTVADDLDTGPVQTLWLDVVSEHGTHDRAGVRVVVPPLRAWATNFRGTLRCEATFPDRYVRPGDLMRPTITITNLGDRPMSVPRLGFLEIRGTDGMLLDDTDDAWRYGPYPGTIAPGETVEAWTLDTRVRWPGELRVRARCAGLRLPAVRLHVTPIDGDVGVADAIERAVAVPGSPFQACPPGPSGEPSTGVLTPPDGRELPPMTLRCWAEVRDEDGFANVDLFMVSPDDGPAYQLGESPLESDPEIPDDGPNLLATRWSFVVTPHRVRPWRSVMQVHALGEGTAYTYELDDGEWRSGGSGTCGFYGYFLGFLGEVFLLDWYTSCVPEPVAGAGAVPVRTFRLADAPDGTGRLP